MTASIDYKDRYIELLKSSLSASLYDESAWRRVEGPMRIASTGPFKALRRVIIRSFLASMEKRGFILLRALPFVADSREKGLDWPLFGYTMTGRRRLNKLQECIETVLAEQVAGDIVETGVWRGGGMIFATALLTIHGDTERLVWCADSFEGMPVPTVEGQSFSGTEDFSDLVSHVVTVEQLKNNFRRFDLLSERVKFLKGWFRDTLATAPIEKIAVLRLDGDLYESTREALVPLYPKLSRGGFVIVDDYNSWEGCKKAVDEYRAEHGITSPIIEIDPHSVYWRVE